MFPMSAADSGTPAARTPAAAALPALPVPRAAFAAMPSPGMNPTASKPTDAPRIAGDISFQSVTVP